MATLIAILDYRFLIDYTVNKVKITQNRLILRKTDIKSKMMSINWTSHKQRFVMKNQEIS